MKQCQVYVPCCAESSADYACVPFSHIRSQQAVHEFKQVFVPLLFSAPIFSNFPSSQPVQQACVSLPSSDRSSQRFLWVARDEVSVFRSVAIVSLFCLFGANRRFTCMSESDLGRDLE
eukprot:GDKI01030075.1.p1 GENE.GDKI01030075.1~~GDKI01030075.1.p1  ORF type:complete len:118 (+),score=0.32 GDKI01030075.1:159-512(+)